MTSSSKEKKEKDFVDFDQEEYSEDLADTKNEYEEFSDDYDYSDYSDKKSWDDSDPYDDNYNFSDPNDAQKDDASSFFSTSSETETGDFAVAGSEDSQEDENYSVAKYDETEETDYESSDYSENEELSVSETCIDEVEENESGEEVEPEYEQNQQRSTGINRQNFIAPIIDYFKDLEEKIVEELAKPEENETNFSEETNPEVFGDEGFHFDENSVQEVLVLCEYLQEFINQLSNEQFEVLQTVYTFYRSPEQLLDRIKILFMGDVSAKEKIVRIYGNKAVGSYKVIKIILDTTEIFNDLEKSESGQIREQLLYHAEEPLKKIRNMLPRHIQQKIKWNRRRLAGNIHQALTWPNPLFNKKHHYSMIVERFREFIFWLYGNPFTLTYLEWKHKYLKYWLLEELHRIDIQNMISGESKIPQYTNIKIKCYQQLNQILSTLGPPNNSYDSQLTLKRFHYSALSQGEAFLPTADNSSKAAMKKAREAERNLVNSLKIPQLATLAEYVHIEIAKIRKKKKLKGKLPSNSSARPADIGSEQKAEQKCMAATVKVHVDQAKEKGLEPSNSFFKSLTGLVKKLNLLPKKEVAEPEPEPEPEKPAIIPRMANHPGEPLKQAQVDWVGYGREFKSTIYEPKIPNLQASFFNHGGLKITLYEKFKQFTELTINFYSGLGYLNKHGHKVGVMVDGRDIVKEYTDEAIYLFIDDETVLGLGRAPFTKTSKPTQYFQLYHSNPIKKYGGTIKTVDFSRQVENRKFHLESYEFASQVRPSLFHSIVWVIDSLPDSLREQCSEFLEGLHRVLKGEKS